MQTTVPMQHTAFIINRGDNLFLIVNNQLEGYTTFCKEFSGYEYESEYERFFYIVGTDAYVQILYNADKQPYLSIRDWEEKEYIQLSISTEQVAYFKQDEGVILLDVDSSIPQQELISALTSENIEETQEELTALEQKYNLEEYSLSGLILCHYTEEDKVQIRQE
ncbi:hypothetical protein HX017_00230 [Myroides marinus]|jgi:hypothetical protein|uniref:Uncharacterized protein n=1 Tax=Myroides marinus TaxID=703342 RepID=A0A1H6R9L8_9FLAO|nr:hypothetical protein [Myroides marinus]MDR0228605.1 hypothetical protein [Flavobacteriaceae bacterium]KUF45353.1 hypothetical protein AS361_06885 [Myroides marinus]MDM1345587.1 hypothetical protein [Myroides marinus]MDM1349176.1 hypothetical protein [Myroides marinus]MDM1352821.1 hypothetical protein [Myroides marinus]